MWEGVKPSSENNSHFHPLVVRCNRMDNSLFNGADFRLLRLQITQRRDTSQLKCPNVTIDQSIIHI